jgi:hypothetical protein
MMKLYQLDAMIGPASYAFEFLAESDDDARALVRSFYTVVHPFSHGPLHNIGESDNRNNIEGVYIDRDNPRIVPLDVIRGDQ